MSASCPKKSQVLLLKHCLHLTCITSLGLSHGWDLAFSHDVSHFCSHSCLSLDALLSYKLKQQLPNYFRVVVYVNRFKSCEAIICLRQLSGSFSSCCFLRWGRCLCLGSVMPVESQRSARPPMDVKYNGALHLQ